MAFFVLADDQMTAKNQAELRTEGMVGCAGGFEGWGGFEEGLPSAGRSGLI
jgi:hypothetical protein